MKITKVVDFRTYHNLNEEEQTGSVGAADQLVDLFFLIYSSLVTKIKGGYAGAVDDLKNLAKMEPEQKGQGMLEAVTKIANKVDSSYTEAANEMTLAAKKIKEAYDTLFKSMQDSEEGKKQMESMKDKIYDKLIAQIDKLKDSAKDAQEAKEALGESVKYDSDLALFEKVFDRFFTEERKELINKITPFYTTVVNLAENSPSEEMKSACVKLGGELKKFMDTLDGKNPDFKWEDKKRRERKEKIDEITNEINNIPNRIMEIQSKALTKLGIDKKVEELIVAASEAIKRAMETLGKEEMEKVEASAEKKDQEAKGGSEERGKSKDGSGKSEIVSGTIDVNNLKKAGKNRESIKEIQSKMNMLLPSDSKIKDDGLYGKNTEKAIRTISSQFADIDPSIKGLDGKKMTPEFRKFIDNWERNKEKIAGMFK